MNAKKIIALLLGLGLINACGPTPIEEEKEYSWVLPEDSMVAVMTDIHIVEGAKIGRKTIGDSLSIETYYQKVWDKHQISQARYDSNFNYYSRNPEKMDEIYVQVLENLSQIEGAGKNEILPGKKTEEKPDTAASAKAESDSIGKSPL